MSKVNATGAKKSKNKKEEALAFLDDLDNFEVVPSSTDGNETVNANTSAGAAGVTGFSSGQDRPATPASGPGSATPSGRPSGQFPRTSGGNDTAAPRSSHDSTRSTAGASRVSGAGGLGATTMAEDAEAAQALAFLEAQIAASSSSKRPMSRAGNTGSSGLSTGSITPQGISTPSNNQSHSTSGQATLNTVLLPPSAPRTPILHSESPQPNRPTTVVEPQSTTSRWGASLWGSASTLLAQASAAAVEVQKTAEVALSQAQAAATSAAGQAQSAAAAAAQQAQAVASNAGGERGGVRGLLGGVQQQVGEKLGGRLGELQGLIGSERLKGVDLERLRQDILTRGSHALTDLLNTVAPPISEHEVLQVWLGHEMKGYEGVVGVVYGAVGNIMEQTSSSDLEVFFSAPSKAADKGKSLEGDELSPNESTSHAKETGGNEKGEEERSINPVKGWEDGWKRAEEGLGSLKERSLGDSRKGTDNPDLPVTTIPVYIHIQPVIVPSPYPTPASSSSSSPNSHLTFVISLLDTVHSIRRTTITQYSPVDWLDVEYDQSDWVEERLVDVLRVGVEVIMQEYVATRMGLKAVAVPAPAASEQSAPTSPEVEVGLTEKA